MIFRYHHLLRTRRVTIPVSRRSLSHKIKIEPLRILFCGSDDFSVQSLQALNDAKRDHPGLIDSIDVLYRPAKPTGRGLKEITHNPIEGVARDLDLRHHVVDAFRGWESPSYINMIIAVSFGLLIPRRIIEGAQFGGLNVHPSLLPDLRGAAPIHHTLLRGRKYTGVTVQTLHPTKFDHGQILAQTPAFDHKVPEFATVESVRVDLGRIGARLLVDTLEKQLYLKPVDVNRGVDAKTLVEITNGEGPQPAPKITPEDRHINWAKQNKDQVLRANSVLGNLWDDTIYTDLLARMLSSTPEEDTGKVIQAAGIRPKRIIFDQIRPRGQEEKEFLQEDFGPSAAFLHDGELSVETVDGHVLSTDCFTIEGGARGNGSKDLTRALKKDMNIVRKMQNRPG